MKEISRERGGAASNSHYDLEFKALLAFQSF